MYLVKATKPCKVHCYRSAQWMCGGEHHGMGLLVMLDMHLQSPQAADSLVYSSSLSHSQLGPLHCSQMSSSYGISPDSR